MDDAGATDSDPLEMDSFYTLALTASAASEMDTVDEDRAAEDSNQAQARFEQTTAHQLRALESRVVQAELLFSSPVDESLKSSLNDNIEMTCNKRIHNVETGRSETCGKTPVVMFYTKNHYCQEHRDLRRTEINAKNEAKKKAKEERSLSNAHPSMSVICALSDDGFYLDVFPGSHERSYFEGKHSSSNPVHFSDSERVHVPQTYAILFHKWFYHCGSAAPSNLLDAHCQLRLFAYVSTSFSQESGSTIIEPKRLRSQVPTSNIPDGTYTYVNASVMCMDEMEEVWLCDKCDGEKVKMRERATKEIVVKPKLNSIRPGTIVAGNLKTLGYIIFRTSISHEECEYLQIVEKDLKAKDWENISRQGKQNVPLRTRREQFPVERASKTAKPFLDIPFRKLRDDILKVDSSFNSMGQCDKTLEQRKLLRNVGPCAKQFPHSDYSFPSTTMSDKNQKDNTKKSRTSAGGKRSIKKNKNNSVH